MHTHTKIILTILCLIAIGTGIILYGMFIGTTGLIVKEYKVTSNKITNEYHGLKIAHISDIHYGRTTHKKELNYLVQEINKTKPDIVVFTGDLIDDNVTTEMVKEITKAFSKINATIGKYAVNGNHDVNLKEWDQIMNDSNFIDLNDEYELIYNNSYEPIIISGISNNTFAKKNIKDRITPVETYLATFNESSTEYEPIYKILLIHEPDYIDEIDYNNWDIILAGHTHNGQFRLPFIGAIYKIPGGKKYYDNYYKLNNTDLYISSGIGTSGFGIRLFNRPSFNLYRITNK